ncbi:MAG TPA: GTPase ObgE, partial [Candidatus Limnocylindrales bacterium]|nr:GTPase ObgE [Candidatus Limnocylindrales bacterium]
MFLDRAHIKVRAGDGGKGIISFRREAHVPRGGPDGGDGGNGGDLVLRADAQLASLGDFAFKKEFAATPGSPGEGSNKSGRAGRDKVVRIPVGTTVRDVATGE